MIAGNSLNVLLNNSNDSGINENNEIISITPAEKASEKVIMASLLFVFIKQEINPNKVENPAREEIVKLKIMFFIIEIYVFI